MATATQNKTKSEQAPASITFKWEGVDKKGNKVKGETISNNMSTVRAVLRKQGINAKKVRKKPKDLFASSGKKITPLDIALFTRQLATMMKAGVPLVQSFEIVADGVENPSMRDLVLKIKAEVEAGNSLAASINKHPQHFDDLFCSLVDAGEQSGALETIYDRIATYQEKAEALKSKIKKAMTYPISVLVIAFVVTSILLIFVVPVFQDIFAGFGAELPAFTQFVIGISEWMQEWWLIVLAAIMGSIYMFKEAIRRSPNFADKVDAYLLKFPIVGNILEKSAIARFGRVLSTTFAAGVPLVDALNSVAGATGNAVFRDAIHRIRDDVASGTQLQFSMKQTNVFPSMAVQMVAIGEESGALDTMLDKVANYFEEEVDNLVDNLTALMEPMIMAVLGVLVGGLIIAMYLPIFQMGQAVG